MPLKKVKRPVIYKPIENEEVPEVKHVIGDVMATLNDISEEQSSMDLLNINNLNETNNTTQEWNNPCIHNQSDTNNYFNAHDESTFVDDSEEASETAEPVELKKESIMERHISFEGDNVRLLRTPKFDKGKYRFRIDETNSREGMKGKYGVYDQYLITYSLTQLGMKVPMQLTIPYTISTKSDSPFMMFLTHLKPIFEGQSITINQLVGLQGICNISHYKADSGDVYDQLEVLSVEKD